MVELSRKGWKGGHEKCLYFILVSFCRVKYSVQRENPWKGFRS